MLLRSESAVRGVGRIDGPPASAALPRLRKPRVQGGHTHTVNGDRPSAPILLRVRAGRRCEVTPLPAPHGCVGPRERGGHQILCNPLTEPALFLQRAEAAMAWARAVGF